MSENADIPEGRLTGRKMKAVLEGGTRVFLERGFAATSMDDVAAAAAVSKRTLYQYFSSKEALFVAVVRGRVENLIQILEAATSAPEGPISLRALAERLTQRAFNHETVCLYRIVIAEAGRMPELGRIIDETALGAALEEIAEVIRRVAAQRGVRLENPAFAADVYLSLLYGVSQVRALLGVDLTHEADNLDSRVAAFERAFGLSIAPAKA